MNKRKLKILFLPKWYPNRFDILDGVFIVDHAKAAAKYHDVFLLFIHADSNQLESKKITINNSNGYTEMIVYFRYKKTGIAFIDKLFIGFRYLTIQFESYNQIKKIWGEPNITHIHVLLRTSFLAIWLKWTKGIPYLITEHWSGYDPKTGIQINWFKRLLIAYTINKAEAITTVSDYLREHIQKISNKTNYYVLTNAIDENLFTIIPKINLGKKKIIHISTLNNHQKNFSAILFAIAKVAEQRTDFELHVIGKGVEKTAQMELAKRLNILDNTVFFHGYLPKENVAEMIGGSDLMILFSHFETQSCVLLESFLCGIPVIAPNIGGVKEIVNIKNGILIEDKSVEKFSETILSFLSGELKFDTQQIRNDALIYGYKSIGNQLMELYQSIIKKGE